MELMDVAIETSPGRKVLEKLREAAADAAARYPYVQTTMGKSDAVLVPNPDIYCFADELK